MVLLNHQATQAILSYCAASILMTVTNKFVLSYYAFHMNFLLLAIQSLVCVAMLHFSQKLDLISYRKFNFDEAKNWFVVSLALVVMIYTGSKALQYMSIPIFTVFKNLTIILIAYGELSFFGGSPVTPLMLTSFLLMVLSSAISGWADITGNTVKKDVGVFVSYFWMILNCLSTAFYALVMRFKIKQVNFKDYDTVFYNNLLSVPVLVFLSLLTEGRESVKVYNRFFSSNSTESFFGLCLVIILSSVSSFAISYGSSWCVRVTSSTTYSMVGALNKLPISIFGMFLFDDKITFGGVFGVLIAFSAGVLYSISKNQQNSNAPKKQNSESFLPISRLEPVKE